MSKKSKEPTPAQPKRQARGQQRIEQILRAAGEVFAETGYENATTNAIAARAGVSPGTLYQFFANKQAIAEALANDYAQKDQATQELAFDQQLTGLPLSRIIDRTIDPFFRLHHQAPGFDALFMASFVSEELSQRIRSLQDALKGRVAELIRCTSPALSPAAVQSAAETSVQIVKGLMPLATAGTAKQQKAGEKELKLVLERYLAPILQSPQQTTAKPKSTRPRR